MTTALDLRVADGKVVCTNCGKPARFGWVFRWGAIRLASCGRRSCQPDEKQGWVKAIEVRRTRR